MRYTYAYRDSEGQRHEDSIEGASRDAVFATLRQQGIRPIKVIAADGSKENGASHTRHSFHRMIGVAATIFLCTVVVVTHSIIIGNIEYPGKIEKQAAPSGEMIAKAKPRKWLEHDKEFLYSSIFTHPSEAYLAHFAEPGFIPNAGIPQLTQAIREDFYDSLSEDILLVQGEDEKISALKHIVSGMKQDAEMSLGSGMTVDDFATRLIERQYMEAEHRNGILRSDGSVEDKNVRLRKLGMRCIEQVMNEEQ